MARYAGQLLTPAEGFGRGQSFFISPHFRIQGWSPERDKRRKRRRTEILVFNIGIIKESGSRFCQRAGYIKGCGDQQPEHLYSSILYCSIVRNMINDPLCHLANCAKLPVKWPLETGYWLIVTNSSHLTITRPDPFFISQTDSSLQLLGTSHLLII